MKNTDKIMLIVPHLQNGGQERICALTADLLNDRYEVQIVLFDDTDILYQTKVPIININMHARDDGYLQKIFRIIRRAYAVRKIKKNEKITHSISFGESANLVNVLSKYRDVTISSIHANTQIYSKKTNRIVIPFSNKVIAICEEMAYELKKKFPQKQILCISNPVNIEEIQKKGENGSITVNKKHDFKLYTMGRIVWEKGYWHLLKACANLCKRGYDIELVHAGLGNAEPYKKLAEELLIADRLRFVGQLENPFGEMKDTDVFVLSSCSEGFSLVITEAMAMGIPVVSVNCKVGPAGILHNDWQEAVSHRKEIFMADYGILAPEVKCNENLNASEIEKEDIYLADAIEIMLKNKEVRDMYRKKGLQRVGNFSKEKYIDRFICTVLGGEL